MLKQTRVSSRLLGLGIALVIMAGAASAKEWKLWYRYPAREWEEALPIGNGRIGGMIFGGIDRERISLNEESIWCGAATPKTATTLHQLVVKEQQRLLFEGKHNEVENVTTASVQIPEGFEVRKELVKGTSRGRHIYKPLADLYLHFGSTRQIPTDYYRDLDLDRAVATVRYTVGDVT
jgi:alpha-L-fucosidase 2